MASNDTTANIDSIDQLALKFLELIHDTIPWGSVPEDVRREKWSILAKRIMSSGGEDLQEFMNNVIRSISGEEFRIEKGKDLENFLTEISTQVNEKNLLNYLRSRAIPLVVRLSARVKERGEEKEETKGE